MKNKINKWIKSNKNMLITVLIITSIIIIFYIFKHVYPFGNNDFAIVDFYHQYYPLTVEFIDRVLSGKTLLYSFNTGMGLPFFKNFFNYLSSPFNIFLLLFNGNNLFKGYSILIGLKVILSSISISIFLNKSIKESILTIPFSISYALCSYFTAYYWNVMWLDGMIFLPLIILGLEKLIKEKKCILYIMSLSILIFANYYIGYMTCIFTFIYFLFYYFLNYSFNFKKFINVFFRYVLCSILSVCLIAFFLIPIYYSLDSISATHDIFPNLFANEFNIYNFIFNNFSGVVPTALVSENLPLPNISSSLLVFILIPLFFINSNIDKKSKIMHLLLLIIMFISLYSSFVNFIWHGFHFPNDLPYRESFIYVFVLIIISYKCIINIKGVSYIKVIISSSLLFIILIIAKILKFENLNEYFFIFNIILLLIYTALLIGINNIKFKKYSLILLILICASELTIVSIKNIVVDTNGDRLSVTHSFYKNIVKNINSDKNDFYRIDNTKFTSLNDGALDGYYGISMFSSMAYESVAKSQIKFGIAGNTINSFYYNFQTPIYNSIFNIKYLLSNTLISSYYKKYNNEYVEYKYPISLAFGVNKDLKDLDISSSNPFLVQNSFISLATGVDNVLNEIPYSLDKNATYIDEDYYKINTNEVMLTITNTYEGEAYLYIDSAKLKYLIVNNEKTMNFSNEPYIVNLGERKAGEVINIVLSFKDIKDENNYFSIYTYNCDYNSFIKAYNILNDKKIDIELFNEDYIKGTISINNDASIFTSIAYDKSWNVYIDGKLTNIYKTADTYIGFDIEKGEHTIEYKYSPKGMKAGIYISSSSLAIFIVLIILKKRKLLHF